MKRIIIVALITIISGCTNTQKTGLLPIEGSYKADITYNSSKNSMSIYVKKRNDLFITMYFSNSQSSKKPTLCSEKGKITPIKNGFLVQGKPGKCENGRELMPYIFPCKSENLNEFKCTIKDIDQVVRFYKST